MVVRVVACFEQAATRFVFFRIPFARRAIVVPMPVCNPRGRPRALLAPKDQLATANMLEGIFAISDAERGDYWHIFWQGEPEKVLSLCRDLVERGYSVLHGQCNLTDSHSFVSRIIEGRDHPKSPKSRRDAQRRFLARYVAVGRVISPKTWERVKRKFGSKQQIISDKKAPDNSFAPL